MEDREIGQTPYGMEDMAPTNMQADPIPMGAPVEPVIDEESDITAPPVEIVSATAAKPRRQNTAASNGKAKPRTTTRPIAETVGLPVNKLTDKEKENLIEYLKQGWKMAEDRANGYKINAERAYAQSRELNEALAKVQIEANQKLTYVNQAVSVFAQSILLATRGDK